MCCHEMVECKVIPGHHWILTRITGAGGSSATLSATVRSLTPAPRDSVSIENIGYDHLPQASLACHQVFVDVYHNEDNKEWRRNKTYKVKCVLLGCGSVIKSWKTLDYAFGFKTLCCMSELNQHLTDHNPSPSLKSKVECMTLFCCAIHHISACVHPKKLMSDTLIQIKNSVSKFYSGL